jgi:hypothetical protein
MRRGDEHLERVLALAYRNLERLTALGVGDRHRHVAVVLTPHQPDLDPVARAAVELACDLGAWLSHRCPPGPCDRYALTTNGRAPRGQPRCVGRLLPRRLQLGDPTREEATLGL